MTKDAFKTLLVTVALVFLASASAAQGYTTSSDFSASDYATGFPTSPATAWGPIGISFDQSDNLYVGDPNDGYIYRFQPGGGGADSTTRLNSTPIPGTLSGLAFARDGALYLARYSPGDVVQIDPQTGALLRVVASVPCATGLAVDPASGDLFVSQNQCGSTLYRISGLSGTATASPYAYSPGIDGLAFDQDGTLYAESDGGVLAIDGTASPTPGLVTAVAHVPHGDGLAFGTHTSGGPPFLVVNGNNGVVTKVDFSSTPAVQSQIFSGGSRGDFAAVDSQGCLYITQSTSIVRIASNGVACAFEPTTPGAGGGQPSQRIAVTQLSSSSSSGTPSQGTPGPSSTGATGSTGPTGTTKSGSWTKPPQTKPVACTVTRSLTLRVSQQGRVRIGSAAVYVNGRLVKQLRGSAAQAPFTLRGLPGTGFTLKVIATTTQG